MTTRSAFAALLSAILLSACDGGITEPSFLHFTSLSLTPVFGCGLDGQGRAYCWGTDNEAGQLGTGDNRPTTMPLQVKTGARFTQIATGRAHSCALGTDGRAWCWGDNTESQLGVVTADLDCDLLQSSGWTQDFGNDCSVVPVPVETQLRFTRIAASEYRTCGLTSAGTLWCWGSGPLGDSAYTASSEVPVRVAGSAKYATFAMGPYHACAADRDGLASCWGYNNAGTLGLGVAQSTTYYSGTPLRINSSAFVVALALGSTHTCALTGGHQVLCWGAGASGQRGDSTFTGTVHDPTFVKSTVEFSQVSAAGNSTCALERTTGAPWCWGENSSGTLGDGTTFDRSAPAKVLGGLSLTSLTMVALNYPYPTETCGVSGRDVYCWGTLPEPLTFGE